MGWGWKGDIFNINGWFYGLSCALVKLLASRLYYSTNILSSNIFVVDDRVSLLIFKIETQTTSIFV